MFCSAYGFIEKRKRFSSDFFKYLDWLEESQFWGEQEIYNYKLNELKKIYKHAYNTVPYYRKKFKKAGLSSNLLKEIEDWKKIPILEKEDIRNNWKDLVSVNHTDGKLIHRHTSGSTGKALDFYVTKRAINFQWAIWWRFRKRFGINFGDKSLSFIGKTVIPINQQRPPYWRVNKPMNQHLVNMQHIKRENIRHFVDYINKEHFVFFSGYPSIIYTFCSLVESLGLSVLKPPKFVFTGAEKLLDNQKACIERVLGCVVTDHYGFSEGAGNASRCQHGVFHEDFEFGHLEVYSPIESTQTGISGELLATGFSNYGMPLLRYNVGDSATWGTKKCQCGLHSATIQNIEGRNEDFIITPEGISVLRFDYLFKDTRSIEECQVVQYKLGEIVFRIITRSGYTINEEFKLIEMVKTWISPSIKVKFEYPDKIERTVSGKFKAVISYVNINMLSVDTNKDRQHY